MECCAYRHVSMKLDQWFSTRVNLPLGGHLASSGDSFCLSRVGTKGATNIW